MVVFNLAASECNKAVPCSVGYVCSDDGVCLPDIYQMRRNVPYDEGDDYVTADKDGDIDNEDLYTDKSPKLKSTPKL